VNEEEETFEEIFLDVDLNGMENAKMIIKSFLLDHREIS
jgi:hypothetical protein